MRDPILVIGAGGFVGRRLVATLQARGDRVIALGRKPMEFEGPGVEVVVGEFSRPSDFHPLLERSRVVVHTASGSKPGTSAAQTMLELETNLRPTLALIEALQSHVSVPLLYLSSGGTLYGENRGLNSDESAPLHPRSYHGAAKVAAEYFIGAWAAQFPGSATIVRPSNIYGPGQYEKPGFGVIPAAFGRLLRGEELHIWGDGTAVRDYLYIDDFIDFCLAIIDAGNIPGVRTFNASSGVSVSLNELTSLIEDVTHRPLKVVHDKSRKVDAPQIIMDATLAKDVFGWVARTSLREGLASSWEWFRSQ